MPKVKAIGTPMKTHDRDDDDKEQDQAGTAHRHQQRLRQPQPAGDRRRSARAPAGTAPRSWFPSRRSNATVAISPAPTRIATTRYPSEICRVISSVERCTSRNCCAGTRISSTKTITTSVGDGGEPAAPLRPDPVDKGGQPHMPVAAQRDDGADHRQPQEQKRGEFVGPDDRAVEHIARDDAGKQDAGLGQHQHRADEFDGLADQHVEREGDAAHAAARQGRFRRSPLPAGSRAMSPAVPLPAIRRAGRHIFRARPRPRRPSASSRRGRSPICAAPPGTAWCRAC